MLGMWKPIKTWTLRRPPSGPEAVGADFAFPDDEDTPASSLQLALMCLISLLRALQLGLPIVGVALQDAAVSARALSGRASPGGCERIGKAPPSSKRGERGATKRPPRFPRLPLPPVGVGVVETLRRWHSSDSCAEA